MTSPFPGMDPFLEGDLWRDVHQRLATKIGNLLTPQLRPKYVARIEKYVIEDNNPIAIEGALYPDTSVLSNQSTNTLKEPEIAYNSDSPSSPITQSIKLSPPIEVRIPIIKIRDLDGNRLVTAIEILSPVNKRKPGLQPYLEKRERFIQSGVHFLEIDLLRGGTRPIQHPSLVPTAYMVALTRSGTYQTDIWGIDLKSQLPTVPIPLLSPDKDVTIDLQKALMEVYQESAYDLSIDYTASPPAPVLSEEEKTWINDLLKSVYE